MLSSALEKRNFNAVTTASRFMLKQDDYTFHCPNLFS